ncbi:hypothetical protein BC835DRAFT_295958 [Cytidiella melzeri]|nr:hypothetical protein BC835DRAFT_295958 [Cytidiella melzeri]
MNDVGTAIPQVQMRWFKKNILPPLPSGLKLSAVFKELKASGHITSEGVWRDLGTSPAKLTPTEDVVFAPFADIAAAIGEAAAEVTKDKSLRQDVVFKCNPTITPLSNNRNNSSKPDGYGIYTKHDNFRPSKHSTFDSDSVFWEFIVAPGEKKKRERLQVINDIIVKILWSFNHIMREDPRRRFVVGYTIENTSMRLWFCSRTDIFVTEPFNFIEDHGTLSHFFLSLMYARSHELGYDTTMKPASDALLRAQNQWDISIQYEKEGGGGRQETKSETVTFRTVKQLSGIGAETIRGRGTRVWRAQQLNNEHLEPEKVVIKDYWVDDDRIREATIRQKILDAAPSQKEREMLEQYLLTPLYSGDVEIEGKKDKTHDLLRRGSAVPTGLPPFPTTHTSPPKIPDGTVSEDVHLAPIGTGTIVVPRIPDPRIRYFHDKCHHRLVFKEDARTIEEVTSMGEVFHFAGQTMIAMTLLHRCGWAHRDISSGNILIVDGKLKLGDIEYAKDMYDDTGHSTRSGTALFMSIEADSCSHEFRGLGEYEDEEASNPETDLDRMWERTGARRTKAAPKDMNFQDEAGSTAKQTQLPPFRHNPLHDIESLWWLLVYLTLNRSPIIPGDTPSRLEQQRAFYGPFFTDRDSRRAAFMKKDVFSSNGGCLHPRLQPVADALERMRARLVGRYKQAEQGDVNKIDHTVAMKIVNPFFDELEALEQLFPVGDDVLLQPIRPVDESRADPQQPAATIAAGTSLDSRQDVAGNKRRWQETVSQVKVDHAAMHQANEAHRQAKSGQNKRARHEPEGSPSATKGDGRQADRESKGKAKAGFSAESSQSSGGNSRPAVRRSQRKRKPARN